MTIQSFADIRERMQERDQDPNALVAAAWRRRYEYLRDRFLSCDPDGAMLPREVLRATTPQEFDREVDRVLGI